MIIRTFTLALLLSYAALFMNSAGAILIEIEQSYEVDASTVTLPGSTAGYFIFRPCGHCDPVSMPVNADTKYYLGGQQVTLEVFRAESQSEGLMYVFYDQQANVATRIKQ